MVIKFCYLCSSCYYGDSTSFCGTGAVCGVVACACADTEAAYTCRPSLLCSGPLFALWAKNYLAWAVTCLVLVVIWEQTNKRAAVAV